MDLPTLGLWEVVGTPIEGVQGETYHATITYDRDDKVVEIKTRKKARQSEAAPHAGGSRGLCTRGRRQVGHARIGAARPCAHRSGQDMRA